jgi:tRNA(fMet)-specific endonuclease VapC
MKYLLDTNICIYIINQKPSIVVERIRSKRPEEIAISAITLAELEYGISNSEYADRNRVALLQFLFPFMLLDFDQMAAQEYGKIRANLESRGEPIGAMDMLIAAQAIASDLILVTNNENEFKKVKGLRIENWSKDKKSSH